MEIKRYSYGSEEELILTPYKLSTMLNYLSAGYSDSYVVFDPFPVDLLNPDYWQESHSFSLSDYGKLSKYENGKRFIYRFDKVPAFAFFSFKVNFNPETLDNRKIKMSFTDALSISRRIDNSNSNFSMSIFHPGNGAIEFENMVNAVKIRFSDKYLNYKLLQSFFKDNAEKLLQTRCSLPSKRFMDNVLQLLTKHVMVTSNGTKVGTDTIEITFDVLNNNTFEEQGKVIVYYNKSSGLWETIAD